MLPAPPASGKLSRKEKVARTGRGSVSVSSAGSDAGSTFSVGSDNVLSPNSSAQLAQQYHRNRGASMPGEFMAAPATQMQKAPPSAHQPGRSNSAADTFFSTPASAGNPNDDFFAFFDPLSAPRAAAPASVPVQQQRAPAAQAPVVFAEDPFGASFDPFATQAAASAALAPAPVVPQVRKSPSPKAQAESSSDSSDSSDDSSDSDEEGKPTRPNEKVNKALASGKGGFGAAAAGAASTGNKSLAAPGAGVLLGVPGLVNNLTVDGE
jgi:hypothetical protein